MFVLPLTLSGLLACLLATLTIQSTLGQPVAMSLNGDTDIPSGPVIGLSRNMEFGSSRGTFGSSRTKQRSVPSSIRQAVADSPREHEEGEVPSDSQDGLDLDEDDFSRGIESLSMDGSRGASASRSYDGSRSFDGSRGASRSFDSERTRGNSRGSRGGSSTDSPTFDMSSFGPFK